MIGGTINPVSPNPLKFFRFLIFYSWSYFELISFRWQKVVICLIITYSEVVGTKLINLECHLPQSGDDSPAKVCAKHCGGIKCFITWIAGHGGVLNKDYVSGWKSKLLTNFGCYYWEWISFLQQFLRIWSNGGFHLKILRKNLGFRSQQFPGDSGIIPTSATRWLSG